MRAQIKEKREVAKGTLLVTFDLLGEEVDFAPGQYFFVTLPDVGYQDDKGLIPGLAGGDVVGVDVLPVHGIRGLRVDRSGPFPPAIPSTPMARDGYAANCSPVIRGAAEAARPENSPSPSCGLRLSDNHPQPTIAPSTSDHFRPTASDTRRPVKRSR